MGKLSRPWGDSNNNSQTTEQNKINPPTHMEQVMVSKAAMKFSQNHPAQHKKLLEVIQTAKTSDKHQCQQQANDNTRKTWSSGMIFNNKKKEEQSKYHRF